MQLTSLLTYTTILLPVATALPLGPSNGAAVEQGIYNIDREVRKLNELVAAYTADSDIAPILVQFANGDRVNRIAFEAATTSGLFTQPESQAIAKAVTNSVGVSIPAGVELLKSKKPEFNRAGYSNSILGDLNLILYDHDSFSAAVGLRLTPDALPEAGAGALKIDLAFRDGVAFYTPAAVGQ